jgi:hypothetical protein
MIEKDIVVKPIEASGVVVVRIGLSKSCDGSVLEQDDSWEFSSI